MNERPKAVFSTEDFDLLREAVIYYLKAIQSVNYRIDIPEENSDPSKFNNLLHRLGRV